MTETPDPFAPRPQQPPQAPPPATPPPNPDYPPPAQPGYPPPAQPGYPPQQGYPPPAGYQAPPPGYQLPPPGYQVPGYAQPYGAPAGYPSQPAGPSSGLAIAALVVGIVSCLGFWIPFAGFLMGLVALVLGIVAWRKASSGRAGGKPMAVIGTVLGALALIGGIIATVFIIWAFGRVAHCTDSSLTDQQRQTCVNEEFDPQFNVN